MVEKEGSFSRRETDISNIDTGVIERRRIWDSLTSGTSGAFILAAIVFLLFFGIIYCLIFVEIPERNKDALYILVGGLVPVVTLIAKYWWDRSKEYSDSKKVEQANNLIEPLKTNGDV